MQQHHPFITWTGQDRYDKRNCKYTMWTSGSDLSYHWHWQMHLAQVDRQSRCCAKAVALSQKVQHVWHLTNMLTQANLPVLVDRTSSQHIVCHVLQPDPAQKPHCIIPTIHKPSRPGAFPGLYAFSLHEQGFTDSDTLLVTSQWYSQTVILSVGLKDGAVQPVTPTDPCKGSWTLQVGSGRQDWYILPWCCVCSNSRQLCCNHHQQRCKLCLQGLGPSEVHSVYGKRSCSTCCPGHPVDHVCCYDIP